jgi:hypothetical protein
MTRIVTHAQRYKRPPPKRAKAVPLTGPVIVATTGGKRLNRPRDRIETHGDQDGGDAEQSDEHDN